MTHRRDFLRAALGGAAAATALAAFPPSIRRALAIPARRRTGTLADVEHVVILMQENRSFDHYFGTLRGVRGFGDRFVVPVADAPGIVRQNVWLQPSADGTSVIAPFHLNTAQQFAYMRVEGTPHVWLDAQAAWDEGRMNRWPAAKQNHSLGYYQRADLPFQFALAEAFTLCDAYHCSFHGGTNPNRVFHWTGTNDPLQRGRGPVLYNDYDNLEHDPSGGYTFSTYCERLEDAGVSWQVYQNMADNFTDNPLAGFRSFRDAVAGLPGARRTLAERGLSTRDLDLFKQDVLDGTLPQVSWIVATAEGSEHAVPSSHAQGADYTAKVLDALTANPEVWSKTVLLLNFDENDGFFDHVPPPAAPSTVVDGEARGLAGGSTVDTRGEYHERVPPGGGERESAYRGRPYGLGPRVPMYVISPWSKGGWVNSEVFDHTSVLRFLERRFGVHEPNISPWRRAVCGDLTSAFDFADPDRTPFFEALPDTDPLAQRARALPSRTTPPTPEAPTLPSQERGIRRSRALPYELHVQARVEATKQLVALTFGNSGRAAAVFHVYDRLHLERVPRRYTVEPGRRLEGVYATGEDAGAYDLWVLGPNGFHRHFTGRAAPASLLAAGTPEVTVRYDPFRAGLVVKLRNASGRPHVFVLSQNAYTPQYEKRVAVAPHREAEERLSLRSSLLWYDFTVRVQGFAGYTRRFAGRLETGLDGFSDPLMGGAADAAQASIESG